MLRLDDVQAFLKVCEVKGFSRAAFHLCISKSVVSDRVARLEREVGTLLLARTSRGVSLTDAGVVFEEHCRNILSQLEGARHALNNASARFTGKLRITMPIDHGLKRITKPLAQFMARHPDLHCYAEYSDECADLDAGSFDLAIRLGRASSVSSKVEIIERIESIVVGAPDLISRVGMPVEPTDLQHLPCLTYLGLTDVGVWHFEIGSRRVPITVGGRFRANTMEALLIAAEAGLGFATMPSSFLTEALSNGRLCRVLPAYTVFNLVLVAHYPPGNRPTRSAEAFVRFLTKELIMPSGKRRTQSPPTAKATEAETDRLPAAHLS